MKKYLHVVVVLALGAPAMAQGVRQFCLEAECPGGGGCCSTDLMEVRFDTGAGLVDAVAGSMGATLSAVVSIDVKSEGIQGWSYAVKHDMSMLSISNVVSDNAGFLADFSGGFNVTVSAFGGADRKTGDAGIGQAVVLSFTMPKVLPQTDDITLAFATYTVDVVPGEGEMTLVEFANGELATASGGPAVSINLTVAGNTKVPGSVARTDDDAPEGPSRVNAL